MLIKNLFERDIFRPINGVVKADQLDDASVWQELDEFVITRELDQHFRKFVSTARVARSAGVPCGRKPQKSCGPGSGNQDVTSHPIDRCSVITAVSASRGSVCGTCFENTAHVPKLRSLRWAANGCTRTACATVPLSICFAQAWRSQRSVNGWAMPVWQLRIAMPPLIWR